METMKNQLDQKAQQEQKPFRGVAIHIPEDGKFSVQLSGGVKLLEVYGALTVVMKQLEKDLGVK